MNDFQEKLKNKMKDFAHFIYRLSKNFPREELYGAISQIRRASLSVILNYIEGYARCKTLVRLNFLEISYGSLSESKIILEFAMEEKWLKKRDYDDGVKLADKIGAMLWSEIRRLDERKGV